MSIKIQIQQIKKKKKISIGSDTIVYIDRHDDNCMPAKNYYNWLKGSNKI